MTDIDFAELDKAVNSLMGRQNGAESTKAPDSEVIDITSGQNSAIAEPDMQVAASPDKAPAVAPSSAQSAPPVLKRQTGRYMDVMRPSASMRAASMQAPSPARLSHTSMDIAPTSDVEQPESTTETEEYSSVTEVFDETSVIEDEGLEQAMAEQLAQEPTPATPMESPFLTDVEVDKRPLGATPAGDTAPDEDFSFNQPVPDPDFTQDLEDTAEPAAPAVIVPPELSSEVLALESDALPASEVPEQTANEEEQIVEATVENSETLDVPEVSPDVETARTNETPAAAVSSGDIVPQYAAQSADAPEPSAIFEAQSETPKQLEHPATKKSGWLVFVWILILALVGAGGGVAAWYFLVK